MVDCDTCGGAGFTHEKQGEIDGSPVLYAKRCPNGCKVEPGEVPSVLNSVGPRGALVRMKGRQIGQTEKMRKAIEAHKGSHAFVTLDEYSVYQQFADVGMLPSIDPAEAAIEQRRESFRRYADVQLAGLICPHMPGEGDLSVNHYTRHGRSLCYQMTRDCPWCGHAERRVYESDVDDMSAHERNRVMDGVGRARERILDALGDCRDAVPELDQVDDDCEHIYTPMAYGEGPTCIRCGGHEPVDSPVSQRVAEEIRTQLVDGLPGEWEAIEGSRHDWVMGAGPHFRAFVVVQCDQPCAVGLVEMRDPYGNWNEVPGTRLRTSATDATDGDDYIMRCAQKLAPKVEAVRAMVEALRGDG